MTRRQGTRAAVAVLAVGCALTGAARGESVFEVDPSHSRIGFAIDHMVINRVHGEFRDYEAKLVLDDDNQVTEATATVRAKSVDTGMEKRDAHLRNDDFLHVERYPTITFVTKAVEERDGKSVLVGDFTLHGVTRELALPFTVKGPIQDPFGLRRLGFRAEAEINRKDYGVTWNKIMDQGGLMIGENVTLSIELEFTRSAK